MTFSTKSPEERLTVSSKQVPFKEILIEMCSGIQNHVGVQLDRF